MFYILLFNTTILSSVSLLLTIITFNHWHWCYSRKGLLTTAACNLSHLVHQNSPERFPLVLSSSLHYPFHHSYSIHPSPISVSAVQPFWQQGIRGPRLWGATSQETLNAVNPNMKEWMKWLELCYRGGQQPAPLKVLYSQISHQYNCDTVLQHWGCGDNQGCQQHLFHSVKEQWRQAEALRAYLTAGRPFWLL